MEKASRRGAPEDYSSYFLAGRDTLMAKDLLDAEALLARAAGRAPGGTCQEAVPTLQGPGGTPSRTEACYRRVLLLDPGCLQAHLGLGDFLARGTRYEEALEILELAVERFPESTGPWRALGALHLEMGEEAEAERLLRRSLELDGTNLRARFHLGVLLLRQGRYEEGWRAYEARPLNVAYGRAFSAPRWEGEDLEGKALLIGQEGGLGDMIQLSRYVPVLKARGARRIGIVCQPPLGRLFRGLPGLDDVRVQGETLPGPDWDFWILPFSLPERCGTTLQTIPAPVAYPDPGPAEAWRARLPPGEGLRVGLAWKGNPGYGNDGERSLPGLESFRPLEAVPGLRLVSLQKGPGEAQAAHPPPWMDLLDASPHVSDFADLAALMAHLDLVVSVDTAVAHLAGTLGKPCWVLLPHHRPDFRWLSGRADSPWYPGTLRLFRQASRGDWDPVMEEVAASLTRGDVRVS
jgi:hypothetical protein